MVPELLFLLLLALFPAVWYLSLKLSAPRSRWVQLAQQFRPRGDREGPRLTGLHARLGIEDKRADEGYGSMVLVLGPEHLHFEPGLLNGVGRPTISVPWSRLRARYHGEGIRRQLRVTVASKPPMVFRFALRGPGQRLPDALRGRLDLETPSP